MSLGGASGAASVAAAPDYASSGQNDIYYTDLDGDIRIVRFTLLAGQSNAGRDPASRRPLLVIEHSNAPNHNGGQLQFGPDGACGSLGADGGGQASSPTTPRTSPPIKGRSSGINPGSAEPLGACVPNASTARQSPWPISAPPPADTVAPRLRTRIKRRQRVLRLRGAVAGLSCNEPAVYRHLLPRASGRWPFRMLRACVVHRLARSARIKARLLTRKGNCALYNQSKRASSRPHRPARHRPGGQPLGAGARGRAS